MANKPLQSITFPDLPDTYTIPQIDASLSTAGAAADAKETGDEISDLNDALNDCVTTPQMKECELVEEPKSPNLWDYESAEVGYLHSNGTNYTGGSYDNYRHGSIGAVEEGDVLKFYRWTGSYVSKSTPTFIVCYDSNGDVISSAGTSGVDTFTVPEGVAEVKITMTASYCPNYMAIKNDDTVPTELIPYYEAYDYYVAKKSFIHSAFDEESAGIMSAEATDEGKYLKVKTVEDGRVAEWEFDEAGEQGDFVEKNGTLQVTPKNLQIMDLEYAPNLIDETTLEVGYVQANGATSSNNSYQHTDYIPVEAGEKYYFTWLLNGTSRVDGSIRFLACYNSSKTIMQSAGSDSAINSFPITIAEGVSYIRASFSSDAKYTQFQFEKGETPTTYHPYHYILGAVINDEYLPDNPVDMADIPAFQLVRGQNLLNPNDPDYQTGKFLYVGGNVEDHASYATSGYIAVNEGDNLIANYVVSGGGGAMQFRTIACYDSNKVVKSAKGVYTVNRFIVPTGISYVRICWYSNTYGTDVQVLAVSDCESYYPYEAYENPHYEAKESYLPANPSKPVYAYLPSDIYVAIGRTIELYNEQVVLDHEKYHFRWVCAKGYAYKRKFSITGVTAGNYNLNLYLYDDNNDLVWSGATVIHVVAANNPEVKILPIGDSLTRSKKWLPEVLLLSSNNIEWLGTRYSSGLKDSEDNTYETIHHEGRSGWGANDYLADSTYTQDTAYDGVGSVDGSANPFWDGTGFSLEHYLTVQTGVDTPDAVQIFLGTNDLTSGVETATQNIIAIVESIRTEYANLPIFLCNTIYRSNQNGYGSTGSDAYVGAGGANSYQYAEDIKVMQLMINLRKELADYTGVYMIPLASCMDREYNFGQTMTKVNPRSTVEVAMPTESVHPQVPGYLQMADLMYSFYCGVLPTT